MNANSFSFTMFLIHAIANAKSKSPGQIYRVLKEYNCIDEYLVPFFDVLHTMGTEYLVDDVCSYVAARGGSL